MMDGLILGVVRVRRDGICGMCNKEVPRIWETRFPDGRTVPLCKSDFFRASLLMSPAEDVDEAVSNNSNNGDARDAFAERR